jgi:putative SOS response-associated peptidase YedK
MCGRYSLTLPVEAVGRLFGVNVDSVSALEARYNIAPSQRVVAVRRGEKADERELVFLHWGFVPAWARDPDSMSQPINARGESVEAKPMFRDAFRKRRCLIPADGFYEWKKTAAGKQPWRIERADGAPFAFAGLWDRWQGPEGKVIESCVIITTEANETMRPIHDRMPVILDIGRFGPWLEASPVEASDLIEPWRGELTAYPVSRRLNDPHHDDAGLIEPTVPATEEPPEPSLF